jgi:thiol:disulfide interchange protein DsbG
MKVFNVKHSAIHAAVMGTGIFIAVYAGVSMGIPSFDSKEIVKTENAISFSSPTMPTTIANLLDKSPRNKLLEQFEVNDKGDLARGWLVDLQGTQQLYWSFGDFVVAGALVGSDGINLTEKYISEKSPGLGDEHWELLTNAMHISANESSNTNKDNALYVFYEPFCGACSSLMNRLSPLMKQNDLDVRLVPVAWISKESPGAIQAMISGKATAFETHEKLKNLRENVPTEEVTASTKAGIIQNGDLMESLQIRGTPAVIYKNEAGKIINLGVANDSELSIAIRAIKLRG